MKSIVILILIIMLLPVLTCGEISYESNSQSKLQHLVFIIQENHSFDNYFGTYPNANGFGNVSLIGNSNSTTSTIIQPYHLNASEPITIVGDELSPDQSDPTETSFNSTSPFHLDSQVIQDLNHSWIVANEAYDNGKMDGFIAAQGGNIETMGYYDRSDIPYYWDYADHYVFCDNFFSSEMGPSSAKSLIYSIRRKWTNWY